MTWGVTIRELLRPKEKVINVNVQALRGEDSSQGF